MARVTTVDPEDFSPQLAEMVGNPGSDRRVELGSLTVWANRPEIAIAFLRFQQAIDEYTMLPLRLRELVRLRVAFHNQCRSCMAVRSAAAVADGMTDGAVRSLERPEEASDLTEAEKAALAYADLLAVDHLSIGDAMFERLRQHFDEAQIIDLGAHIGLCVGFGRLAMSWDIVDDLPPSLRDGGTPAVPWSSDVVVR
jgi:AhpD family alkylhydroperoxidase